MTPLIHKNIPDSAGMNAYATDIALQDLAWLYLDKDVQARLLPELDRMGDLVGRHLETLALTADKNPPTLQIRARNGADLEVIHKHPSYVELERYAFGEFGLAAMSHRGGVFGADAKLPPMIKYALVYLFVQAEFGLCCPLSMTDSLTRTLVKFGSKELIDEYFERLTSQDMDELFQGSMFMTEQVAGSDVGAIETTAKLVDGEWKLTGDKWFCSNPDAALGMVLARPEGGAPGTGGLSLFLLPRVLPDGTKNNYRILRLKEKMGTKSMASGEIVMEGATAYLVGDPGQGFKQMTDMINMSRLANGVRSAGMMRRAVSEALFISKNRTAFGKRLIDLPLMRRQLMKMMVTAEQGRSMVFHTAQVLQAADAGDAEMAKVLRILTPLIKFRTCRDARKVAGDGMEVRGGCGYIEEWSDARVLRDSHLGSIWEGTSNIVALDVTRAVRRAGSLDALRTYVGRLLADVDAKGDDTKTVAEMFNRATDLLETVANDRALEVDVRVAASAVYNATSAAVMIWEDAQLAGRSGYSGDRKALANAVIAHKLRTRDPLAKTDAEGETEADIAALLDRALADNGETTHKVAAQ
ncbi:acyl-CoA dehydrogenase family protein [Sulfitobacter sp. F26169L]|uniref:acyl-CoA dehydrogenase family protein n=1 Tax=Sulfitobacter sp. F26169L TaxID=2996015 RepID=UPI002260A39E|nr:acyl-CoA dehydrogenase family protein [Sulfitobacter sp. F26169L]MCX7567868.1 acyl-CoA dehydrogenase family protein [Sulfitobacter sp. F26169L]